jgi:hypothetical protein
MPSLKHRLLISGIYTIFVGFILGWAESFTSGWHFLKLLGIIALLPMFKAFVPGNEHIFFTHGY